MTKEEAKEFLKKLKPLEKIAEFKRGGTIDRFIIVPIEYLTNKNYSILWLDYWKKDFAFCPTETNGDEYTIVAIKRVSGSINLISKDIDEIKELYHNQWSKLL